MRYVLIILLACITLSSCVTYNKCISKFGEQLKPDTLTEVRVDTFETVTTKRDTVRVKGDSIIIKDTLKIQADCPDGSKAKVKVNYQKSGANGSTTLDIKIVDSILEINCKADSLIKILVERDKTITILKDSLTTIKNTVVMKPPVKKWYQFPWYIWLAIILVLLTVLTAFLKKR